jgi:Uma2 family endonuclease
MGTTTALLTVDEFLKLPDIEERRVELIQGEVVDMPGGGPVHEIVKANLIGIVRDWLKGNPNPNVSEARQQGGLGGLSGEAYDPDIHPGQTDHARAGQNSRGPGRATRFQYSR